MKLTEHERKILNYLNMKGGVANRMHLVADLASPASNLGRRIVNGSNGAIPMVMARWCERLIKERYVIRSFRDHQSFAITSKGVEALKSND